MRKEMKMENEMEVDLMDIGFVEDLIQVRRESLPGAKKSPLQVGRDRANAALRWIYNWGWSTQPAIELLVGNAALVDRLVRCELVTKRLTNSRDAQVDGPTHIFTLTQFGVSEAECLLEEADDLIPYKRRWHQVDLHYSQWF